MPFFSFGSFIYSVQVVKNTILQQLAFDVKFAQLYSKKTQMAETLGSLCDKLTIVKLKEYHTEDHTKLQSLQLQEKKLKDEINDFVSDAVKGLIPLENLTYSSNKVYKKEGNETRDITGNIGEVFAELASVNNDLWHQQEKVYEFGNVPAEEKDSIVKKLAILNLERNKCIDSIDRQFQTMIAGKK
jgi:hypothetical protein